MAKQKPQWTITVTRIGTPDVMERLELYEATSLEAEQRLGRVWNEGYCTQPGRFRAHLRDADRRIVQTID